MSKQGGQLQHWHFMTDNHRRNDPVPISICNCDFPDGVLLQDWKESNVILRLADKQAKPCLLACLLVLAVSKQASRRPYFWAIKQAKEGFACLYVVNLAVAVVGSRP